jgi:hypothetical protein
VNTVLGPNIDILVIAHNIGLFPCKIVDFMVRDQHP